MCGNKVKGGLSTALEYYAKYKDHGIYPLGDEVDAKESEIFKPITAQEHPEMTKEALD